MGLSSNYLAAPRASLYDIICKVCEVPYAVAKGESIKILVIEDEDRIATFIQRGLKRACEGVYDFLVQP